MNESQIVSRITALYPDAQVAVAGEGCNFQVQVLTPAFEGVKTLGRQRAILDLFKEELATGELHALGVKAKTPAEMQQSTSGGQTGS
jgi:acid stress-induced BolA-like protein IbaG/YrbA